MILYEFPMNISIYRGVSHMFPWFSHMIFHDFPISFGDSHAIAMSGTDLDQGALESRRGRYVDDIAVEANVLVHLGGDDETSPLTTVFHIGAYSRMGLSCDINIYFLHYVYIYILI